MCILLRGFASHLLYFHPSDGKAQLASEPLAQASITMPEVAYLLE